MSSKAILIGGLFIVLFAAAAFYFKGMPSSSQAAVNGTSSQNQQSMDKPTNAPMVSDTAKSSVKEFTVTGQNFSFTPKEISINKGDTVKVTFKNAEGFHNFVIDEFNVKTNTIKGGSQEIVQFVADKTGSFQYYCSVGTHRAMGMWGTLKVN